MNCLVKLGQNSEEILISKKAFFETLILEIIMKCQYFINSLDFL